MKIPGRTFLIGLGLVTLLLCVIRWQMTVKSNLLPSKPEILSVDPSSVRLQRAKPNDSGSMTVSLTLKNQGRRPIKILGISTSCGCTVVGKPKKWELKRGDSTILEVQATIPDSGERNSRLQIRYENDQPSEIVVPITLVGAERVIPFVHFIPEQFEMRGFEFDDIRQKSFEVVAIERPESDPWLIGFDCGTTPVHMTTKIVSEESHVKGEIRRTYCCEVAVKESAFTDRPSVAWLQPQFRCNPPATITNVRLTVQKVPAVRSIPAALFVSKDQATRFPIERRVLLINETAEMFGPEVDGADSGIEVERLPGEKENACVFLVRIREKPAANAGPDSVFRSEIRLKTSIAATPEVRIPLTIEYP